MSFRIFASGLGRFQYSNSNCADGDVFEAAALMSALRASGPGLGGAAEGVADYVVPSEASSFRELLRQAARMTFAHYLKMSTTLLATSGRHRNGWIRVHANESNTFWPDTARFVSYDFRPGNSPGAEFVETVAPVLTDTGLNNYGVMREMTIVISRYEQSVSKGETPMLLIQLSH